MYAISAETKRARPDEMKHIKLKTDALKKRKYCSLYD